MASEINPVKRHGYLKIAGRHLHNQHGDVVQLRGVSSHGLHWHPEFINRQSFVHLRDHWRIDVIRLAMYLDEGGYIQDSTVIDTMERGIELAIETGLYVVVDWHVHANEGEYPCSGDPRKYTDLAVAFFLRIAEKYEQHPNLIYEIANEPSGVSWPEICEFATTVIDAIRSNDQENLIVVGTPHWSQNIHEAAQKPLSDSNLAYALHFYAGSHTTLLERARAVVNQGLPLFVTEWGATLSSGDGGVYEEAVAEWMRFLSEEKISWINWSLCDKPEDAALLKSGAAISGPWTASQLTASGLVVKTLLLMAPPSGVN